MPITPWLNGFTRIDLDLTGLEAPEVGRPYDETSHPKICLHTTEGATLEGAERAFAAFPPHIGVRYATRQRHQYLPLDRCSFSLRGSESDDEFVVQVEIQGYASSPPGPLECDWLGREVIAPIAKAIGCPLVAVPQGFHGPGEGIVLASSTSPIRFRSEAALRAFSGVMGHQHAPAPDEHWDPGRVDIGRILTAANEEDDMALSKDETKAALREVMEEQWGTPGTKVRAGAEDVLERIGNPGTQAGKAFAAGLQAALPAIADAVTAAILAKLPAGSTDAAALKTAVREGLAEVELTGGHFVLAES